MRFKVNRDYYLIGEFLYTKNYVNLEPGLTVLVGCNGSGKSTFLDQIRNYCEENKIAILKYDNLKDGGTNAIESAMLRGNTAFAATNLTSSEGESLYNNIGEFTMKLGRKVSKLSGTEENKVQLFILLDACDSGLSIDNIVELKDIIKNLIVPDCNKRGIEPYFIASANSYEFAHSEDCIDVQHMKHIKFYNYEDYKKFILDTSEFNKNRPKHKVKE